MMILNFILEFDIVDKKIQVGYGTGRRGSSRRDLYGTRQSGKVMLNGGFNNAPTVDYTSISEERWNNIFKKNKDGE